LIAGGSAAVPISELGDCLQDVRVSSAAVMPPMGRSAGTARQVTMPIVVADRGPWIAGGLLIFAAVWLSALAHDSLAPPVDNVEQLTWVRSLEWGYYKHPPLPTWLAWLPVSLFGLSAWTGYVLGAACTLTALGLMWRLLVALRGQAFAGVALLAALCITYYNGRLHYYNHNVVLLLLSTASATLCWQAFSTRKLRWWFGLGLAIGLGALAKYQIAVTVASVLVFAAHQRAWRDPVHRSGALLASVVALVVFAPHAAWLQAHDFAPIHYAVESSLGARFSAVHRTVESLHWLLDQVFNRALPAWLLLAVAARASAAAGPEIYVRRSSTVGGDAAKALLLCWGLVPLLFMPLAGVVSGADLQLHWGTPFLLFAVPALMALRPRAAWEQVSWRPILGAFVVIQLLLLALSHATSQRVSSPQRNQDWRGFDPAALAERVAAPARQELGGPIRVVSGPAASSGALALQLAERPLVLIDGRLDRSPWVAPDLVQRCGALQIGLTKELAGGRPFGAAFPTLAWNIVPRDPAAAPCPPLSVD
jgi:4-amino-4-deoxy-L-arabinose transferase-like glycosyltransferase